MTTRGLSLMNPCNIMHSDAFTWSGEVVPSTDPDGRLCQFTSFVMGIRAGAELVEAVATAAVLVVTAIAVVVVGVAAGLF